jgi:low temperature requirement protein LtrA
MLNENAVKRPRLRSIENLDQERHASWLELFFDLIFVLAVAQVAHSLNKDLTLAGFLGYLALFLPVWWAWVGYSFYADRFESDEVIFRLLMFAGMLAMAALAVNVNQVFHGGDTAFAVSYIAVRGILIALYLRAAYYVPLARELSARYAAGFLLGLLVWLASFFVPAPVKYWLWVSGFLIELCTPFFNLSVIKRTPYDASHVPERFGLFTLIVIGEAVLTGVTGVAGLDWELTSTLIAACGFAIVTTIWWMYYEFVESTGIRQGSMFAGQVYLHAHFFIAVGVAAIGVATQHAIQEARRPALSAGAGWLLCGSVALFLWATVAIRLSAGHKHFVLSRLLVSAFVLSLAALGQYFAPLLLTALLFVALIAEVWFESVKTPEVIAVCEVESVEPTNRCAHTDLLKDVTPNTVGCEECIAGRYQWVHLRMCRICGHIGCCDSSQYKHATGHFEATGHPIIKSIEPGENWSWCYVDETYI